MHKDTNGDLRRQDPANIYSPSQPSLLGIVHSLIDQLGPRERFWALMVISTYIFVWAMWGR
jgi:hypothetical protein